MDDSFALDRQIELDRGCVQPENVREFARTHPAAGAAMNAWLGWRQQASPRLFGIACHKGESAGEGTTTPLFRNSGMQLHVC
jgi:hypothetical protein